MNRLNKVTEFRDYFKFRSHQLIRRCRPIPVLMRDKKETGYRHHSLLPVRFFVANNLDLIYNYVRNTVIDCDCADCNVRHNSF